MFACQKEVIFYVIPLKELCGSEPYNHLRHQILQSKQQALLALEKGTELEHLVVATAWRC